MQALGLLLPASILIAGAPIASDALHAAASSPPQWTVLQNTDWPSHAKVPYGNGTSAADCANQCLKFSDCAAVSWNGPNSTYKNGMCNFKCNTLFKQTVQGEEGVVVRKDVNYCHMPPPPPPPTPPGPPTFPPTQGAQCDVSMPSDWLPRCQNGDLFYSGCQPGVSGCSALMPDTANGYIGTVAKSNLVFAGGLFNGDARGQFGGASHRAKIPSISVTTPDNWSFGGAALDVRQGIYYERYNLGYVRIESRYYAHQSMPSILVHEIEIQNNGTSAEQISLQIQNSSSNDLDWKPFTYVNSTYAITGANKVPEDATSPSNGNHTMFAAIYTLPALSIWVASGSVEELTFLSSIVTSLNSSDVVKDAIQFYESASAAANQKTLLQDHKSAWESRLDHGSINVVGDLRLAQAVNASLYVIRSSIREDWPYGLSPGGLTSNGYNGHTFWDQETWMWPPLLLLDPPSASSALDYRWNRIVGASLKAKTCGQENEAYCQPGFRSEGAFMFPWESAFTGVEVQNSNGKIGPWGEFEQHISGDISFAARQYFYATQDIEWLKTIGFPLIKGIATFYAARQEDGAINNVMGPDEYHSNINNSRYTNAVASLAIQAALEFGPIVNETLPSDWAQIVKSLKVGTLPVPPNSGLNGTFHPEYDGYNDATVKQADTVMLSYPFMYNMSDSTLANDLEWYEPHTDVNGPAMTWAIFAIGWFNDGQYNRAAQRFRQGFEQNVHQPFNVWSETLKGGCTPFLTGAGGFLQSVVFGVTGLRLHSDGMSFTPAPPVATGGNSTAISVHFNYRGSMLKQTVTSSQLTFEVTSAKKGAESLVLIDNEGFTHPLTEESPFTLSLQPCKIKPTTSK